MYVYVYNVYVCLMVIIILQNNLFAHNLKLKKKLRIDSQKFCFPKEWDRLDLFFFELSKNVAPVNKCRYHIYTSLVYHILVP